MVRVLGVVVFFVGLFLMAESKGSNLARRDRAWKARKSACELQDCSHLVPEEAYNCVNKCTSSNCFLEIYAENPLEDGELDLERERNFKTCLRKEYKENQVREVFIMELVR